MKPKTTDDVLDFLDAVFWSAALGAAMELGLFWRLAERPLAAPELAAELGIPRRRCDSWLQVLCATGLLDRSPEGYVASPVARTAILEAHSRETWAFLAGENREGFPLIVELPARMREPRSVLAAAGLTPPDYLTLMAESTDRAERFTRMLYEIHQPLAEALAVTLDMSGVDRMMDLGGGSGVMSLALLRRYSRLSAVVVDIPNVCAAGRKVAAQNGMAQRISYLAADFLADDLPTGFDLILECDVGVYGEALWRKLKAALNPGGRLVIIDQFAPADGVAPPSRLTWAFQGSLADPESTLPTTTEVAAELERVGFRISSQLPLPVDGTARWSQGITMMEACV